MEEKVQWLGLSDGYCLLYGRERISRKFDWVETLTPPTHVHICTTLPNKAPPLILSITSFHPKTQGSNTCLWGIFHMKTTEVGCLRSSHMVSTLLLTTIPTSTCLVLQFLHRQLTLLMDLIECMPLLSISLPSQGKSNLMASTSDAPGLRDKKFTKHKW